MSESGIQRKKHISPNVHIGRSLAKYLTSLGIQSLRESLQWETARNGNIDAYVIIFVALTWYRRYGHAFLFDSGSSVGEIAGPVQQINAVDIKSTRPFKAVCASDDMTLTFFAGPPFKFQKSMTDHTRFVQDVKYSPDGTVFASVGSDSKVCMCFPYHSS